MDNSPIIIYDSLTGKTKSFVEKTGYRSVKIQKGMVVTIPYILVTFTAGRGQVPSTTMEFLEYKDNHKYMLGVASAGHRNWGEELFAKSGDKISEHFNVPMLHRFEMRGREEDVTIFKGRVEKVWKQHQE